MSRETFRRTGGYCDQKTLVLKIQFRLEGYRIPKFYSTRTCIVTHMHELYCFYLPSSSMVKVVFTTGPMETVTAAISITYVYAGWRVLSLSEVMLVVYISTSVFSSPVTATE